jgi:hypothetical protein
MTRCFLPWSSLLKRAALDPRFRVPDRGSAVRHPGCSGGGYFLMMDSTQAMKFVVGSPLSSSACVCAMAHTVAKSTLWMP